jgi:hypothetical protein
MLMKLDLLLVFYAKRQDSVKAKAVLKKLYGSCPSYDVDAEYDEMINSFKLDESENNTDPMIKQYLDCFRGSNL